MQYRKVHEMMSRDVKVIAPDDSIQEAAQQMRNLNVGLLPVCDGKKLRGMISDRDIAIRAVAENKPMSTPVKEIMSQSVIYISQDSDILEAARLMELKQIRRLVVLDHDKQMTGIISLGDISLQEKDLTLAGEILREVSERPREQRIA